MIWMMNVCSSVSLSFFCVSVDQSLAEEQMSGVGDEEENVVPLFTEQECVFFLV